MFWIFFLARVFFPIVMHILMAVYFLEPGSLSLLDQDDGHAGAEPARGA